MPRGRKRATARNSGATGIRLIAAFRLLKGALLIAAGVGALSLLHKHVGDVVATWVRSLRVDPDNHLVHRLLVKLNVLSDHKLEALSAASFLYAALLIVEGVGLWRQRRWAEYLTVVATSVFIPVEIYEIVRQVTVIRVVILILNAAIVLYLIGRLRVALLLRRLPA
jgi:uncharacterized membrane protein (DUF2068 family)